MSESAFNIKPDPVFSLSIIIWTKYYLQCHFPSLFLLEIYALKADYVCALRLQLISHGGNLAWNTINIYFNIAEL